MLSDGDNDDQSAAIRSVMSEWGRYDPAAAGQWLQQVPAGPARDSGISAYVSATAAADPATSMQLASGISNNVLRNRTIAQTYRQWAKQDPTSANAWLSSSTIDQKLKNRLLSPKNQ